MRLKRVLTALGLALMWAFAAQADETLISGAIRVGAYDVEVQNASRTNWVDGDLVIAYLNTDTSVTKSFTLPRPTTARLLAVGGGGAGGQLKTYSSSYGLPGGGGAGGMVANDSQSFSAATYAVTVGAGGVAPRSATKIMNGANGGESSVKGTEVSVTAGGGGGGARAAGQGGGSGGGSRYSGGDEWRQCVRKGTRSCGRFGQE